MKCKLTFPVDEEDFIRRWMEIVPEGDSAEQQRAKETARVINRAYNTGYKDAKSKNA